MLGHTRSSFFQVTELIELVREARVGDKESQ